MGLRGAVNAYLSHFNPTYLFTAGDLEWRHHASDHGQLLAVVRTGPCRRRHVQAFWPECNVLLGRKYDPVSGEPDYNTSVTIEPAQSHAPSA